MNEQQRNFIQKYWPWMLGIIGIILLATGSLVLQDHTYRRDMREEKKKQQRSQEIIDSTVKANVLLMKENLKSKYRRDSLENEILIIKGKQHYAAEFYNMWIVAVDSFTVFDIERYYSNSQRR